MSSLEEKDLQTVFKEFGDKLDEMSVRLDGLEQVSGIAPKTEQSCLARGGVWSPDAQTCKLPSKPEKTGETLGLSAGKVMLQDVETGIARTYSVLPQEPLKSGEALERETDEFTKWFMTAGTEHQKAAEQSKQKLRKWREEATGEDLREK